MVSELILISSGAALAGVLVGISGGAFLMNRRMTRRIEEVGRELTRLQRVAEEKLLEDDPDLPDLMRNLNKAVEQSYRAIDALENQSSLNRQKTDGAKEIVASSRHILQMMEDMGADVEIPAARPIKTIDAGPVAPEPSLR